MANGIRKAGKYDEYTQRARDIRMKDGKQMERPNLDKSGRRVGESTHIMTSARIDDREVAFPLLYPDKSKPNRWIDYSGGQDEKYEGRGRDTMGAYDEARKRGEVFEFGQDVKESRKFAEGSWKPK